MRAIVCMAMIVGFTGLACGGGTNAAADPQNPPMGRTDLESWLSMGLYKSWKCESSAHDARAPSVHGKNRICSNAVLSASGSGAFPTNAASVKELFDDAGSTIIGYAVQRHTSTGTTGASWYWYERVPLNNMAPHDSNGVVADGLGASGPALSICVGCHSAAGPAHSGHDMVFTQIQ
jgi:hypothetical protein